MKYYFTCRKCDVSEATKERTEHKLSKLDKFFKNDSEAHITFSKDKHASYVTEVTIDYNGVVFRAEQAAEDLYSSVDKVIDVILRQITKNKTKIEKKIHSVHPDIFEGFGTHLHEEADYDIIRNKKFFVKPMDIEEAILQMNMLGHEFFMFRNASDEEINVVYRRKDGKYGVIEPVNA